MIYYYEYYEQIKDMALKLQEPGLKQTRLHTTNFHWTVFKYKQIYFTTDTKIKHIKVSN